MKQDAAREKKYSTFMMQLQLLQTEYGYKPEHLHVCWECDWKVERLKPDIAKFLRETPLRPLTRLQPQKSVKASLNDAYVLHFSSSGSSRKVFAADMSSLFPYCSIQTEFPVGRYIKLVGDDISPAKVCFQERDFFYDGKPYMGLLQVRVLPPRDLFYPFLLTTIKEQSLAVLCRTCAETMQQEACGHDEQQRCLTDIWTTAELNFAVTQMGYKVLSFYEFMLYPERRPILQKFCLLLAWHKICSAPLANWVDPTSCHDLEKYCSQINEEMQFQERIGKSLQPKDLKPSKLMRAFFKQALNTWLGNFSTNLDKRTTTKFLDCVDHLHQYAVREQIVGITPINSRYVQVTLTGARSVSKNRMGEADESKICRKACATVGAFITSVARVIIFQHMLKLIDKGADILKVSCDALYFTLPQTEKNPLVYSESFGCWKSIYPGDLHGLCQLGVNNYAVLYENPQDRTLSSEAKCSGMTMSYLVTNELNYNVYLEAVNQLVSDKLFTSKKYTQIRKRTDAKTVTVGYVRRRQSIFSRNVLSRRAIIRDDKCSFVTRPYGWIP